MDQNNGEYVTTYLLNYDNKDRVIYVKTEHSQRYSDNSLSKKVNEYAYDYAGNKVICTSKQDDSYWTNVHVLNNFGYLSESCTYTKGGSLLTSLFGGHLYDFSEYHKITDTTGEGNKQKTTRVIYYLLSKELNNTNLNLNYLFIPNYTTLANAQLIGLAGSNDQYLVSYVKDYNNQEINIDRVTRNAQGQITEINGTFQAFSLNVAISY